MLGGNGINGDMFGWRIARRPAGDNDGGWTVVFRMDEKEPGAQGPQIVVTGSPMASTPDDADDEDSTADDDAEEYVPYYGNRVFREYQFRGADGKIIASRVEKDPDEYLSGWESETLAEAIERGQIAIELIADTFSGDAWDGSIEALG